MLTHGYAVKASAGERRLSEKVASALLAELTSGVFAPGDRLPSEREMGIRFGVSRTVIREALQSLATRGVVAIRPGAGVFALRADPSATVESLRLLLHGSPGMTYETVHEVRETIEVRVAELAAERASAPELEALNAALERLDAAPTGEAFAAADADFHLALAILAHNDLFRIVLEAIGTIMLEVRRQTAYLPGARARVISDHRRIAESVMRRDAVAARAAMEEHLTNSHVIVQDLDASARQLSRRLAVAKGGRSLRA